MNEGQIMTVEAPIFFSDVHQQHELIASSFAHSRPGTCPMDPGI
jgi:hypothetical protein